MPRMSGFDHIPSESLEPAFAHLVGTWWDKWGQDDLPRFQERLWALWCFASCVGATHAVIVLGNHIGRIQRLQLRSPKDE